MMHRRRIVFGVSVATCLALFVFASGSLRGNIHAAEAGEEMQPMPVEADMHEFMEYYFQPVYKRVQTNMASAPSDSQGWKAIKSDSIILAEGGNVLLNHKPEKNQADWIRHSVKVRDSGGEFYRAAQSKDFPKARMHYEAMLKNCNACHQQFADGEHQLKP